MRAMAGRWPAAVCIIIELPGEVWDHQTFNKYGESGAERPVDSILAAYT